MEQFYSYFVFTCICMHMVFTEHYNTVELPNKGHVGDNAAWAPGAGGVGGGGILGSDDPPFSWKRITSLAQLILLAWLNFQIYSFL